MKSDCLPLGGWCSAKRLRWLLRCTEQLCSPWIVVVAAVVVVVVSAAAAAAVAVAIIHGGDVRDCVKV